MTTDAQSADGESDCAHSSSSLRVLGAADDGAAGTRAPAAGAVSGTLLVIRSGFPCSMCFPCGVPGLFQMVCQLFFSVLAPLSNDAHLLSRQIFATERVTGMTGSFRAVGGAAGRIRTGVFVHESIVPQHFPEQKRAICPRVRSAYGERHVVNRRRPDFPGAAGSRLIVGAAQGRAPYASGLHAGAVSLSAS